MNTNDFTPAPIDLTLARDKECVPIARELLRLLASHDDLLMGSNDEVTTEVLSEYYGKIYAEEFAPILLKHNVKLVHVHYLFQLMLQALDQIKQRVDATIEVRKEQADAHLWGVADTDEIRIGDLQTVLEKKYSTPTDR